MFAELQSLCITNLTISYKELQELWVIEKWGAVLWAHVNVDFEGKRFLVWELVLISESHECGRTGRETTLNIEELFETICDISAKRTICE